MWNFVCDASELESLEIEIVWSKKLKFVSNRKKNEGKQRSGWENAQTKGNKELKLYHKLRIPNNGFWDRKLDEG